ncbi:hypothetical protein [Bosea sp. (in: a-proteobacteria)]|jgi:hypothetical protein|uniref:hypothetical protein n=1 Tax=Bosea sp. (in: a-proteobacteria) TaxID=1871050 RepID=UPI003F715C70
MASRHDSGRAAGLGAADLLGFIAAPTFAAMALLTAVLDGGATGALCAPMPGASPMTGMALMYALMSGFHAAPWLRLIADRRGRS